MTAIISRTIAGPDKLAYTKSPNYRFFWPCRSDVGTANVPDRSGQGNNGIFGAGISSAWGTAGQVTTTALGNTTGGFYAPVNWNHGAGQSILVFFEVKRAAHTTERELFGHRNTGEQSLVVKTEATTGKGTLVLRDPSNNLFNKAYTNQAVLWDNTWKKALVWVNGDTNRVTFRINGTAPSDINDEPTGLSAPGNLTYDMGFGYITGAGTYTHDMGFRNIHVLVFDSPPSNIQTIIETLEANPWRPLSAALAP